MKFFLSTITWDPGPYLHVEPSAKGRQLDLSRSVGKPHYSNHQARPTPNLSAAKTRNSNVRFQTRKNRARDFTTEAQFKMFFLLVKSSTKARIFSKCSFTISGKLWQHFSLMVNQSGVEVVYSPLQFINDQRVERKCTLPDS